MRIFSTILLACFVGAAFAVTVTWDSATPVPGQTITGTEILVDGVVAGETDQNTLAIDDSAWMPGDYAITARHVGVVDGVPSVSDETPPLMFTVPDSGAPGVAPQLRFHSLDGAS
jgi:hypothetical protein